MVKYKSHFACFACCKTFKRRLLGDIKKIRHSESKEAKCPECGALMANMGKDFEAPKKNDAKAWEHIRKLYSVGIAFHSCGCTGPGYIPNTTEALRAYLNEQKNGYEKQLTFWRQRVEPQNQSEADREMSKNGNYILNVPDQIRPKKGFVANEDARNYWISMISKVNEKLAIV